MDNEFGYQAAPQPEPVNLGLGGHAAGYSLASMILGIATVVLCCCCCCLFFLASITGILAIIYACLAKRDNGGKMPGKATAGMILGIIGLVLFLVLMFVVVVETVTIGSMSEEELNQFLKELEQIYADAGMDVDLTEFDNALPEASQ